MGFEFRRETSGTFWSTETREENEKHLQLNVGLKPTDSVQKFDDAAN